MKNKIQEKSVLMSAKVNADSRLDFIKDMVSYLEKGIIRVNNGDKANLFKIPKEVKDLDTRLSLLAKDFENSDMDSEIVNLRYKSLLTDSFELLNSYCEEYTSDLIENTKNVILEKINGLFDLILSMNILGINIDKKNGKEAN